MDSIYEQWKRDFVASRVKKRSRNIGQFGCIIHKISNKVSWTGQAVVCRKPDSFSFSSFLLESWFSEPFFWHACSPGRRPFPLLLHRCYVVLVFQERRLPLLPLSPWPFLPPGILSSIHSCFHLLSFSLTGQLRPEFLCDFLRCWVVFRRTVRAGRWAGWETVIYLVGCFSVWLFVIVKKEF